MEAYKGGIALGPKSGQSLQVGKNLKFSYFFFVFLVLILTGCDRWTNRKQNSDQNSQKAPTDFLVNKNFMLQELDLKIEGNQKFFYGLLFGSISFISENEALLELCSEPPASRCFQELSFVHPIYRLKKPDLPVPGFSVSVKCFFLKELSEFFVLKKFLFEQLSPAFQDERGGDFFNSSLNLPHNLIACFDQDSDTGGWSMVLN